MAKYIPAITAIDVDDRYTKSLAAFGGWNPSTKKASTLKFADMVTARNKGADLSPGFYALDTLALAIESGALDENNLSTMLSGADLDALCDELADMAESWVNDRHFHALAALLGDFEEQLNSYPNIGDALRETFG